MYLRLTSCAGRREVVEDPVAQVEAEVAELAVAGGVGRRRVLQILLAGTLGDHDQGVPARRATRRAQVRQETVHVDRHLGDQHVVGVVVGQRRVAGDEAAVPAHQLHQADPAGLGGGLDVRGPDRLGGLAERGLEPEAVPDVRDVVVDRLRHADHGDPPVPAPRSSRRSRWAPRIEPSPPITKRMLTPSWSRQSTISSGSWLPREVPRMVPPCSLMYSTLGRGQLDHGCARAGPPGPGSRCGSRRSGTRRSARSSSRTRPRITSLSPGQSPPQVTMPTRILRRVEVDLAAAARPARTTAARRYGRPASPGCRRAAPGRSRRRSARSCRAG